MQQSVYDAEEDNLSYDEKDYEGQNDGFKAKRKGVTDEEGSLSVRAGLVFSHAEANLKDCPTCVIFLEK